jgi:hypothetical protein
MSEEKLRNQLRAQIKSRAMIYYHIFLEIRAEFGQEKAVEILKRAIYKRGLEIGKALKGHAPADLEGLRETFCRDIVPDEDRMFAPEVRQCDENELDIKFHACPLKEAYQEAGLSEEEMAVMLDIASRVDYGTFEGAGFEFSADTWKPGKEGCCHLHIRPGKND